MAIPKDPIMLLSYINTQLRDNYPTLEELCRSLDVDEEELKSKLLKAGYVYNSWKNQFKFETGGITPASTKYLG